MILSHNNFAVPNFKLVPLTLNANCARTLKVESASFGTWINVNIFLIIVAYLWNYDLRVDFLYENTTSDMWFFRAQDLIAVGVSVVCEWQSENFSEARFFANASWKMTRAENVEDFYLILFHVLDCLVGQFTSNSMSAISWIDGENFSIDKRVDMWIESEYIKLWIYEIHQAHDFLELFVVGFWRKTARFSVCWLKKIRNLVEI